MSNDSKSILKIISDFKSNKWSTSKIESDLEISNGLLGKAAKGKTKLSDDKFNKLVAYHIKYLIENKLGDLKEKITTADKIPENAYDGKEFKKINQYEADLYFSPPKPWIKEIEDYCAQQGIIPADLIEMHKNSKRISIGKKSDKEERFRDFTLDKSYGKPYNPMDNPIFKSKMGIK